MPTPLGDVLVREGMISVAQLEEALRAQIIYGGRLGTNLVELGFLDLDQLTRALAIQFGVPPALQAHFEQVKPEIAGLIPARLAEKHTAVALGITSKSPRTLAVAFAIPGKMAAIDELAFAAGVRIQPAVAPELRIYFYLEKLYGVRRRPRYIRLDTGAARPEPGESPGEERRSFVEPHPGEAPVEVTLAVEVEVPLALPGQGSRPAFRPPSSTATRAPAPRPADPPARPSGAAPSAPAPVSAAGAMRLAPPVLARTAPPGPSPVPAAPASPPSWSGAPVSVATQPAFVAGPVAATASRGQPAPNAPPGRGFELTPARVTGPLPSLAAPPPPLPASAPVDPTSFLGHTPLLAMPLVSSVPFTNEVPEAAEIIDEPVPAPHAGRPALSLQEALFAIGACSSREVVGNAVLDHLRSSYGGGLVLIVREEMALGWKGFAAGVETHSLESVAIPLGAPSMLKLAVERRTVFRGAPPADGAALHSRLWKLMRCAPPAEVVLAPVLMKDRVVTLVYAHPLESGRLPDSAMSDLASLCSAASAAFARLIQAEKRRALGAASGNAS